VYLRWRRVHSPRTNTVQLNTPSSRSSGSVTSQPSSDDFDNLPYPQPLQRSAFLSPGFSPSAYLSTLQNRHQTLSDLRAELRTRSQTLAKELLDLVNNEYQAFLHLGGDLRGGEEKVEEVRVGVLGFVKGLTTVRGAVEGRQETLAELVEERERIRRDKEVAKDLIEVHTRIGELEETLAVTGDGDNLSEDESDAEDADEDEGGGLVGVGRLSKLVQSYLGVGELIATIGPEHPYLVKQEERLIRIRSTLLLDLGTALKQAKAAGKSSEGGLLKIVALYADMDEPKEAIKVLKETVSR
jgi:hypothetical protein